MRCVLLSLAALLAWGNPLEVDQQLWEDECDEDCALVALQRQSARRNSDESLPRSDKPTSSKTSPYKRPPNHADMEIPMPVSKDCRQPPCSGQIHLHLGGSGEIVVSFVSQPESDTEAKVRFGKAGVLEREALGKTESYSQLMFWSETLFKPVIAGGHGISTEAAAKDMSTTSWAYDKRTGWKYPSWREIGAQQVEADHIGWYKNPGERYDSPAIHTVVLSDLQPGVTYTYQVDNDNRKFEFTMPQEGQKYPYHVGLVGDIGQTPVSNSSMHLLSQLNPELVLMTGDLSYADGFFPRWDSFGIMFEPLGARVPSMTCPGNHEYATAEAFKSFAVRYPMPYEQSGSHDATYWSRDIGPMHVVSLNSYGSTHSGSFQYKWLERDLKNFDRTKTPWLVVVMHAPWYNSNLGHLGEAEVMREDLEDMLFEHGVNLVVAGHVHSYERTWPVYKNATHPCGPVFINIGDGGNYEGPYSHWLPGENSSEPAWSAFRQGAFGIGHLEFSNASHVKFAWKRNACFDHGEVDFDPANCSSSKDNSRDAVRPEDESWIVRSTSCPNQK